MLVAVCNLLLMLLQMLAWTEYARAALLIEAPYYEEVFGNDVVIRYNISTAGIICVSLTDQGKKLLKDSCLVPTPVKDEGFNVLKLSFVPIGVMAVTISEVDEAGVTQFTAQTSLEVQQKSEIIPSYDWQPLRKWHSIPAGLETRLPLGGVGRKECRIPTPYRLQLPLPTRGAAGRSILEGRAGQGHAQQAINILAHMLQTMDVGMRLERTPNRAHQNRFPGQNRRQAHSPAPQHMHNGQRQQHRLCSLVPTHGHQILLQRTLDGRPNYPAPSALPQFHQCTRRRGLPAQRQAQSFPKQPANRVREGSPPVHVGSTR